MIMICKNNDNEWIINNKQIIIMYISVCDSNILPNVDNFWNSKKNPPPSIGSIVAPIFFHAFNKKKLW